MAELLEAHVLDYPGGYTRSVGPVIGRFLTGLRDARIEAVRLADGRVLVPPTEYDPTTSAEVAADGAHWIEVGPRGTVQTFTWVAQPRAGKHPLTKPFAFALIRPDGADTALLHVVDCGGPDSIRIGSRVAPRWRAERTGHITDIEAWIPLGDGEEPEPAPLRIPAEDEQPVTGITTETRLDYQLTAGAATARYLAGLGEGKIIGARAPSSQDLRVGADPARRRQQHVLRIDSGRLGRGSAHGPAREGQMGRRAEARPHLDPLVGTDRRTRRNLREVQGLPMRYV